MEKILRNLGTEKLLVEKQNGTNTSESTLAILKRETHIYHKTQPLILRFNGENKAHGLPKFEYDSFLC